MMVPEVVVAVAGAAGVVEVVVGEEAEVEWVNPGLGSGRVGSGMSRSMRRLL